jgi:hypothetical protein
VLPVEAVDLAEAALFLIKPISNSTATMGDASGGSSSSSGRPSTQPHGYTGVGVFISPKRMVTADHNLADAAVGSAVHAYNPELRLQLQVRVVSRDSTYGYAVLEYEGGSHTHFLPLYQGAVEDLRGASLALCAYHIGSRKEGPEFPGTMGVMRADGMKPSKQQHHLLCASQAWAGDSGRGAVVMLGGQLVGVVARVLATRPMCGSAFTAVLSHVFAGALQG